MGWKRGEPSGEEQQYLQWVGNGCLMVSTKKSIPCNPGVRSSRLGWGHSHPTAAAGLPGEERHPGDSPQPAATCPCWSWAVCAEAGTAWVGGLTSSGNDVS